MRHAGRTKDGRCALETCPNCLGRREITGPRSVAPGFRRPKVCPTCEGAGEVRDAMAAWVRCDNCDGWAMVGPLIGQFTCGDCNGYGFVPPPRRQDTDRDAVERRNTDE